MTANKLFSLPAFLVGFILFADLVLAVLQNVTVDDAVQIGSVVPGYLPAPSDWNQGGQCPTCDAQPDPSYAYNGTWHDITFTPAPGNIYPSIQITFVGSGLYIFFIFANNLGTGITTFTNVEFILDDVVVSTYTHNPTSSASYDYNQTVYANNSIPYGEHTMLVAPVNDSINSVLILFDYFIYTTDSDSTTTSILTAVSSSSATSSPIITASSVPNVGAIVGGTIAGVSVLSSVIISVIWYRRRKGRTAKPSPTSGTNLIEPFDSSPQVAATSRVASSPIQRRMPIKSLPPRYESQRLDGGQC